MDLKALAKSEVKKHVGAIHTDGKLSLLQRKIANVLLFNAYDNLLTEEEHQIRIRDLAEFIGFDSNDRELLKDATRALMRVVIEWNILDEKGREGWSASPFLAQARIDPGSPMLVYAYSPDMRRKLYDPRIYARINLSVQREFRSGYALALYEQCVRYRVTGEMRSTGWRKLELWRRLLGVRPGQYGPFKDLRRRVIDKAVKEINRGSDILIAAEFKKEKRRVVEVRFMVRDNPQTTFKFDFSAGDSKSRRGKGEGRGPLSLVSPLHTRLLTFGLSDTQASRILEEDDEERIAGNLDLIESQLEAGKEIKNIPGYTLKAIEDDYRPREIGVERAVGRRKAQAVVEHQAQERTQREREEQERREAVARAQRLDDLYASLPTEQQQAIDRQALERLKSEVRFVFTQYERAKSEGKKIEEMSVVIRSMLRSLRKDLLEEMEAKLVT